MNAFFKEPLVHFLLIGGVLFLLHGWKGETAPPSQLTPAPEATEIVVARQDIDQLENTFTKTWQRQPTAEERRNLIESFIRDEIYYREARAMDFDRQDVVIRRRMRQQMEFIFEDITSQVKPTEDELIAFLQENFERYQIDPQLAFRHIYLGEYQSVKKGEEQAQWARDRLAAGADPATLGEPFLQGSEISLSPLWDIAGTFGEQFTNNIQDLDLKTWHGPLRSPYGLHLIWLEERKESRLASLAEVSEEVTRDLMRQRQQKLKDEAYAKLRQKYTVVVEKPQDIAAQELKKQSMRRVN